MFRIEPPLNEHELSFIKSFSHTRRMVRTNGPLYVSGGGYAGQDHDPDVVDYNSPPRGQPGLWCQWTAQNERYITWSGGEKFYYAFEWLQYLITHLLGPEARDFVDRHWAEDPRLRHFTCDHELTGEVLARGEEESDVWGIVAVRNELTRVTESDI